MDDTKQANWQVRCTTSYHWYQQNKSGPERREEELGQDQIGDVIVQVANIYRALVDRTPIREANYQELAWRLKQTTPTNSIQSCNQTAPKASERNIRGDLLDVGDKFYTDPIDFKSVQLINGDNATRSQVGDNITIATARAYSCGFAQCDQQPSPRL